MNSFYFTWNWIKCSAWWAIAILASSIMCVYSIYDVWSVWKNNPIIVATESKWFPICDIPFPAVSICPLSVSASNKFNYTATYRLLLKLDDNNARNLTAAEYVEFFQTFVNISGKMNKIELKF